MSGHRGFSFTEILITLTLIGFMAVIGVVQYQKFSDRSRTIEAQSELSKFFAAEKSFFGEWNAYTVNVKNIGFVVSGQGLNYTVGFTQICATSGATYPVCTGYPVSAPAELFNPPLTPDPRITGNPVLTAYFDCHLNSSSVQVNTSGATWTVYKSWYGFPSGFFVDPSGSVLDITNLSSCNSTPGNQSFRAHAWGSISRNPKYYDVSGVKAYISDSLWSIDQNKKLIQVY